MLDTVAQRNALLASIEKARNSSLIAYVLHDNAMIGDDGIPQLYDKLHALGKRDRIDLLLSARGGVSEVCWRVLTIIREYCNHLGVIVGTRLQGAGALLALGADEIVMGPLSELGGVEAVRKHPLAPHDETDQPLPLSLSEIKSLLGFLAEASAGEAAQKAKAQAGASRPLSPELLSTLFEYVHPLVIAHLQQTDTLSREVTRKALLMHMSAEDEAQIARLVELFNGGFHSPMYTAGRAELIETGLPVTEANGELWSQIWGLLQLYNATIYNDRPDPTAPGALFRYVCLIESMGRSTGLRQSFTQSEGHERVLQIRWETALRGPGPGPSMGPGGLSNN